MAESMDATSVVDAFVNENHLYWDRDITVPLTQVLYQTEGSPFIYLDEAKTIRLNIISTDSCSLPTFHSNTSYTTCSDPGPSGLTTSPTTTPPPTSVPSNSVPLSTYPPHQNFNREQTLYLIDLMRAHLTSTEGELPKSLAELGARIRMARGQKKLFWSEVAQKLTEQFHLKFDQAKVARKWSTLEDAFKKIKDNNKSTGRGVIKFEFYSEMEELIGTNHDVDFPVIGDSMGVQIKKPEALRKDSSRPSSPWLTEVSPEQSSSSNMPTSPEAEPQSSEASANNYVSRRRKKRSIDHHKLLNFLQASEEATQRRHDEIMAQMSTSQKTLDTLLQSFLEKQSKCVFNKMQVMFHAL